MKIPNLMKKQLLIVALVATFLKLLFIPQSASAQNSRVWGTYYGTLGQDLVHGLTTDPAGNVFMSGITDNGSGLDTTYFGWHGFKNFVHSSPSEYDQYLVKFDANGNRLWGTYYGDQGCPGDMGESVHPGDNSVATDAAGNVYLGGTTNSITGIALQGFMNIMLGVQGAAYLAKFDNNGNRLWGTYYYGAVGTWTVGNSVATDIDGNVYLAGWTESPSGIASGGFQNTLSGQTNCFLVKFDANGNRLWATYYGGNGGYDETADNGLSTDPAGNVYLVGQTNSSAGIASGGFQNTCTFGNYYAAFLVKFDSNGNRLWGTYYGNNTQGSGVVADAGGNVYMIGTAGAGESDIATPGSFLDTSSYGGAFLVKFDSNGNRLWGTYYGSTTTIGRSVASKGDNVWMGGVSYGYGPNMAYDGFQDTINVYNCNNIYCEFLVKFDSDGNRQCATYYATDAKCNGPTYNRAKVAVDSSGMNVYLVCKTGDTAGIATPGSFQDTLGEYIYNYVWSNYTHSWTQVPYCAVGAGDVAIVKFTSCVNLPPVANFQSSASTFCANNCINYTDMSVNATSWQWNFSGGSPAFSTDQNPQNICYLTAGTYNAQLIVSNSGGSDTLTFSNLIHVIASPPTPVIIQHNDTLFCSTDPSYTAYQWYDSSTIIPGATDTFLVVSHIGNYNVKVSNENGCNISVGINIGNVGFNEFLDGHSIALYPNPVTNQLLVNGNWPSAGKVKLTIINVLGEIIYTEELNSEQTIVNCKRFASGMYFLKIQTEKATAVKRFVKE